MSLADREKRVLQKDLLPDTAIPKLWKDIHRSAQARIWLANHYLAAASLAEDRIVNSHNYWFNKGWHRKNYAQNSEE